MTLKNFFKTNFTISLLIILSLIIIINNFFRFFQNNSVYEFDPWLSNYQGGFVRRGMPGEFFYQIQGCPVQQAGVRNTIIFQFPQNQFEFHQKLMGYRNYRLILEPQ